MRKLTPLTLCLSAIAAFSAPVCAADNLTKGCDLYKKGQYGQALPYLQDTVSKNPRQWAGHYYLGHEYMALNQQTEAYQEYNLCRTCKPPAPVMTSCTDMLNRIYAASRSTAHPSGMGKPRELSLSEQNALVERRQLIMNSANERASRDFGDSVNEVNNRQNRNGYTGLLSRTATTYDKDDALKIKLKSQANGEELKAEARRRANALDGH